MATILHRVNPLEHRDAIVDFFWRMRAWPYSTREEYDRYWTWRYTAISESDSIAWLAYDGSKIVGHVACSIRNLRYEGDAVRAGLPGNLLVDAAYRNSIIGPQLAGAPLKLARRDEVDIVISYANDVAHAVLLGLGSKALGSMHSYVQIRRWAPILDRRIRGARVLAPLADAALGAWNLARGRRLPRPDPALSAHELSEEAILAIDRSHWRQSPHLVWNGAASYLVKRFLKCPIRNYRIYGITDSITGRCEGFVVGEGLKRFNILQCEVNSARLPETHAVQLAIEVSPGTELALVPLLPVTTLGTDFSRAGYLSYYGERSDRVLRRTKWSALWRASHPLASLFANPRNWKLWYAWSHH